MLGLWVAFEVALLFWVELLPGWVELLGGAVTCGAADANKLAQTTNNCQFKAMVNVTVAKVLVKLR